ncbi:MAG: hypothetical protein ACREEQ_14550, partial [Caulobacteraceae bacterium]
MAGDWVRRLGRRRKRGRAVRILALMGMVTEIHPAIEPGADDTAPGDERLDGGGVAIGVRGYLIGLVLVVGGSVWIMNHVNHTMT